MKSLAEEKEAKSAELERFQGYKDELIDIVNEKESQLVDSQTQVAELTRQLQSANLSIEKVV